MDPERPIEKLLRACAEKRRQQAQLPSELHPATRRLLQGEVARQFARGGARQPRSWWSSLISMPRLAWVASGAAVVLVLALVSLPSARPKQQFLARNDLAIESKPGTEEPQPSVAAREVDEALPAPSRSTEKEADKSKALAVVSEVSGRTEAAKDMPTALGGAKAEMTASFAANAPSIQAFSNTQAASGRLVGIATPASEPAALRMETSLVPAPVVAPTLAPTATVAFSDRQQTPGTRFGLARPNGAPSQPASPASRAVGDYYTDMVRGSAANSLGLSFVRTPAQARLASRQAISPSDAVLASFKLIQEGDRVEVIDQDGSVYIGSLQASPSGSLVRTVSNESAGTDANRRLALKRVAAPEQPPAFAAKVPAGYFFRVAGTNKSLNQKVVFTGSLWPVTNGVGQVESTNRLAVPGQAWLFNSRVSGKAVINDRQEVDITASPATR